MSDSVRTKIRKALKYQLSRINGSGGYINTVAEIFDEGVSMEQIHNYPAIVIQFGDEDTMDIYTQRQTFDAIHKRMNVYLFCFLHSINDMPLARETMVQDVERLLGTNHSLPGQDGVDTCFQVSIVKSIPFGIKKNKPNGGVEIRAVIDYRQKRTDPTEKV